MLEHAPLAYYGLSGPDKVQQKPRRAFANLLGFTLVVVSALITFVWIGTLAGLFLRLLGFL